MCGIVGYVGYRKVIPVLIESLKRLEYRGYDSAGIGYIYDNKIEVIKKKGRIENLIEEIKKFDIDTIIGIGHTRWATHGKPSDNNAHPHQNKSATIAVVHNGIIENYKVLKQTLIKKGYKFNSETDTEVIVHLIEEYRKKYNLEKAILISLKKLKGSFAIAVLSLLEKDKIFVCRSGSPLVIGLGREENFIASDIPAILNYTNQFLFLEEDEYGIITKEKVILKKLNGTPVKRKPVEIKWDVLAAEKQNYKHFMLKEIFEQPEVIKRLINAYIDIDKFDISFDEKISELDAVSNKIDKIEIVACGTSYHSAMVGRLYIEELAKLPVEIDIGSEYRYRKNIIKDNTLMITISQSGETADTLASLRKFKLSKNKILSICNVIGSSIARESDFVIFTEAGPEIGVASTKAYTAQVLAMLLVGLYLGIKRKTITKNFTSAIIQKILKLPEQMERVLKLREHIHNISSKYFKVSDFLFLGRYYNYPTSLEGALKLKEISYIHAEGYAAGEMKHGPIALIDENLPVVAIATIDSVYEKVVSNLEEVKARQGILILIINENDNKLKKFSNEFISVPKVDELLSPIINIIPLQMLAYEIANWRGCDIDKPRNLAKSVTVE